MEAFRKILFPVDLSDVSPKIAPYVKELADKFDAEVHLLFVARIYRHFVSIYVPHPSIDLFEAEIAKGAQKRLKEFVGEHFGGLNCVVDVISGDPAEMILEYAEKKGIDLIVMGTHGRKGMEKVFFGSVAENVVKRSQVPVLTINPYTKSA